MTWFSRARGMPDLLHARHAEGREYGQCPYENNPEDILAGLLVLGDCDGVRGRRIVNALNWESRNA